ncbi:MAG: hypothetical protein KIH63_002720 [Candidatus Saccharibacteria bacterium]|nr:hypothetical protein [Candidatus Saccharibacteria bacterium]
MSGPAAESFSGFPAGYDVTVGGMDRRMQEFLLTSVDVILNGTEHTPGPVWQAHYLNMLVVTGLDDPHQAAQTLDLEIKVPISPEEFDRLRSPSFEPLPPEITEYANQTVSLLETEQLAPGVLDMLFDDAEPSSEVAYSPVLTAHEVNCYHHNMAQLARADVIEGVASALMDRLQLERFLAEHGVDLEPRQRPFRASQIGAAIRFKGNDDRNYALLEDKGVSGGSVFHGNYTSPLSRQHLTTIGDDRTARGFYGDQTIHDRELWQEVVRHDMAVVQGLLYSVVEVIRDDHAEVFGDESGGRQRRVGDAIVGIERQREYFEGWQQFLPPGSTLLFANQKLDRVNGRSWDIEQEVRLGVATKGADTSRPNTMVFWTDENPEGDVRMIYRYHPTHTGQNEFSPRIGGIYTGGLENHKPGQPLSAGTERAMRNSSLTDQDVADAVAGKRWGLDPNPFSHEDFYGAIEFIGRLAEFDSTKTISPED